MAMLIVGFVLLVIGLVAMIPFGFATPGQDTALNNAVWETGLTVGSAILIGVGALLVLWAIVRFGKRRASQRRAGIDAPSPTEPQTRVRNDSNDEGGS